MTVSAGTDAGERGRREMSEKTTEFENWAYAIENFAPRIERVAEMEFGQAAAAIWEAAWLSSRRQALEEAAAIADGMLGCEADQVASAIRREAQ